jgi:predicted dehydrogenase
MREQTNPSRRALIGAAMALPASAIRSSAANSAPSVGVIGVGNRGTYLAALVARHTPARLAAVSDLFEERMVAAAKTAGGARQFADYRELLRSDVDAVIIATPVFLHAEHLEAAVQAGKHIYIEKPAAASVADCKKILRITDAAPRRLNISFGFQRRYGAVYQKAKAAQEGGAMGKVRWAQAQFIKSVPERRGAGARPAAAIDKVKNWGAWQHLSGDLIVENNIHVIDVMNWFVGTRPLKAHGTGGRTGAGYGDMRDHVHVTYTYPGEVQGLLVGSALASPGFRDVREQFHGAAAAIETSENYWKLIQNGKASVDERSPRNISIDSIEAFVARVAGGKPENTGPSGVESTLTAILGRMAMDSGREVTWEAMMASE